MEIADEVHEKIEIMCEIADAWTLWLIIGVVCVTSSVISLMVLLTNRSDNEFPLAIYLAPPGICSSFFFFTCIFSPNFMIYFPALAKAMISTFAFCTPGLLAIIVGLVMIGCDSIKRLRYERLVNN